MSDEEQEQATQDEFQSPYSYYHAYEDDGSLDDYDDYDAWEDTIESYIRWQWSLPLWQLWTDSQLKLSEKVEATRIRIRDRAWIYKWRIRQWPARVWRWITRQPEPVDELPF